MRRPPRPRAATLWLLCAALAHAACASAPPVFDHPERAYRGLQDALASAKIDDIWQVLDEDTRATWRAIWHTRRATAELLALFAGDDVELDAETRALREPPARAEDLFAASLAPQELATLRAAIDPAAPIVAFITEARYSTRNGDSLPFVRDPRGTWGFSGFAERARLAARNDFERIDRLSRLAAIRVLRRSL